MRTWLWCGGTEGTHVIQILVFDGVDAYGITYGGFLADEDHTQLELGYALPNGGAGWKEIL